MKKGMLLLGLFVGLTLHGQDEKALEVGGGYETNGYLLRAAFSSYLNSESFLRFGIQANFEAFDEGLPQQVDVEVYLAQLEYYHALIQSYNRVLGLYIGGGAFGGFEALNDEEEQLENGSLLGDESQFVYGVHLGAEGSFHLAELNRRGSALLLIVNVRENYFVNSDLGSFQFNASGGLRILF
jgi:hypothetical protein